MSPRWPHPPIRPPTPPDTRLPSAPPRATLDSFEHYDNFSLADGSFAGQRAEHVHLYQLLLRRVKLGHSELAALHLSDARLVGCDLAGAHWPESRLQSVQMSDCRLMGFAAPEALWRDVRLDGCNGSLALFRFAQLQRVRFEGCTLREADLYGATLSDVVFRHCDLSGADLSATTLARVDLRGSKLEGLRALPDALPGLTIDPTQAVDLVRLFGVTVTWEEER